MADLPTPPVPPDEADAEAEIMAIEARFPELERERWQLQVRTAYLQGAIGAYQKMQANETPTVDVELDGRP